ncbi:AHH domain-containing protein [Shewanella sp. VB17]|uniref:AHH domain-containing protein n=1 Tax=Shewanella sp. VB17 TaxID=2739432 RepID=UPI001565F9BE|nr:AHH domain-containing protein [Shewanella sp. VB17]NRD75652.1 AHH domain-containing protein [Shewanella sp. VB17]
MKKITLVNGTQIYELEYRELRKSISELVKEVNPEAKQCAINQRTDRVFNEVKFRSIIEAKRAVNEYRIKAKTMSNSQLVKERHVPPRLGKHMSVSGMPKPSLDFEAHAIISGASQYAIAARAILARYKIRIDDPVNGVWLPNFVRNVPHDKMPKAPAHRTVHTIQYYLNLDEVLVDVNSKEGLVDILSKIRSRLVEGRFPYKDGNEIDVEDW